MIGISARGVSRVFSNKHHEVVALNDFNLEIKQGEFVCIVGPSGCGKSTFLRITAGLMAPSAGEVSIAAPDAARPACATVFQEYSIFPWRTVSENVRFGLDVAGCKRAEATARVDKWLDIVGLTPFRDAFPRTLSGGMKQRVALARALVVEPQVLLMDEPFAALDAQLRLVLQEELLRIWQEFRHTVILVTHSIDEAILLGDRIVLMTARPGKIKQVIDVPFARPRAASLRGSPDFARLEEAVWHSLREELETTPAGKASSAASV